MELSSTGREDASAEMISALDGAKLLGYNERGYVCVWSGGYGFNVYDAARDWREIRYFTSGELAGVGEQADVARERMEGEGFDVIEP